MVSIIIVNYNVKEELFGCIDSIVNSKPKVKYEIIVVDNSEKKNIQRELLKKFPFIKYVPNKNRGFGEGNNTGTNISKGDYLFFLNPDTEIIKGSIGDMVDLLKRDRKNAVVAPLLLDSTGKPYPLQGTKILTPKRAIFSSSLISKIFPNNKILRDYWNMDWNKKGVKKVDVVPGSAFMIRRSVFEEVGGFDKNFFLFFEEFDLFKRIGELNYKIFMTAEVTFKHAWGMSVKKRTDTNTVFKKSRFYYFHKHFGFVAATITQMILSLSRIHIVLAGILTMSLFLNLYRLSSLMTFIGDQGWFYLSARDMLLTGNVPLVGIASSHPWLHQGPFWTYLLGISLWIGKFNPVSGAVLTAILGTVSVGVLYSIATRMFSQKVGLIAAFLYAFSPLVILNSRFAYHTNLIPLCVMLFIYFLSQWITGKTKYLPLILLVLAFLYNFELATVPFFVGFLLVCFYGFYKRKDWFLRSLSRKTLGIAFLAFIIPMLPVIIYDLGHGFPQTVKFFVWIFYAPIKAIINVGMSTSGAPFVQFLTDFINNLVFLPSVFISWGIILASLIFLFVGVQKHTQDIKQNRYIIFIFFILTFGSLVLSRIPSDAYLPMLYPLVILIIALAFSKLSRYSPIILVCAIGIGNITLLLSNNYQLPSKSTATLAERYEAVDEVINLTKKEKYNLLGRGRLALFPSSIMNYEYLLWLKGDAPVKENVLQKIYITEGDERIMVEKKILYEK